MPFRQYPLKEAGFRSLIRRGFTLIELMIAVAVMAILVVITAPSFNNALLGSRLSSYANNLVASAITARSEAIKRNVTVTMCASADGVACATTGGWEQGWMVGCPTSDNTKCDPAGSGWIVIQRQQALASGLKISESIGGYLTLTFSPIGVGATQAALTVCRASPTVGSQERVVSVSATGRASVTKTTNARCT